LWWLYLFGFDPLRLSRFRNIPWFVGSLREWRRLGGVVSRVRPMLDDRAKQAGECKGHYFHQDYWVARQIFVSAPQRHVDVGSRIDGFVAHVATFREIEVLDVRQLRSTVQNIKFRQANLMESPEDLCEYCDSLSCLHALEHFGLGRYGDQLDPNGHHRGFKNLISLLTPGGMLYISFPIGRAGVEFNAHRVFDPAEIFDWPGSSSIELQEFVYVDDAGDLCIGKRPEDPVLRNLEYGCGIYAFRKKHTL
jgi:hypothetical protein